MHIEMGKGAKWKLVYQFTQSGAFAEHYAYRYTQVYVPDDDIVQLAVSINEMFNVQEMYGLELAQPSLCSSVESHTIHVNDLSLWKQATTVLRYSTFVEIMVPLFSMRFFKTDVIKTLSTSASGYGLDWIWPFLLKYSDNKIAVIDEVCVIHPRQSLQELGKMSMYDTNPLLQGWELQEEKAQFRKFGYSARRIRRRYKVGYQVKKTLGQVWQPWYADLRQARNKTDMISVRHGTKDQNKMQAAGMQQGSLLLELPEWTWTQLPVNQGSLMLTVYVTSDGMQPDWLRDSAKMSWGLIVVAPNHLTNINCPHCLFIHCYEASEDVGRYQLLHQVMQTTLWQQMAENQYQFLYFPDERVVQDVSAINTLLHTSMSKNLGLAHLSYCSPNNSMTGRMQYMKINPSMTLRYGTYIDTSAPLFGWWFLRQFVVETLVEAEKGDSLGFLWPYLAGYPKNKVAIIDLACIMEPLSSDQNMTDTKVKALTTAEACQPEVTRLPLSLEAARQCQTFQYNPVAFGMGSYITQVLGFVPQPWYERLLKSAHLQIVPLTSYHISVVKESACEGVTSHSFK
ncbi:hypothetical protein ABBQ32_008768 [Trebouxia sp. C0010 RCD-2024]